MENSDSQEIQFTSEHQKTSTEKFAEHCNEAYEILVQAEKRKTEVSQIEDASLAIRRMMGLFIDREEYEKCSFLKKFLDENFEGNKEPLFDYRNLI